MSLPIVRRLVREMVEDMAADGVRYLEVRTTPKALGGDTRRAYVLAVLEEIQAMADRDERIVVRLLLSINRAGTLDEALETVALAHEFRDQGVVGVDFSGNPKAPPSSSLLAFTHPQIGPFVNFLPAIQQAQSLALPLTIHFAEIRNDEESWAILKSQPGRLGHASYLTAELEEEIRRQKVPVEICLTSNVMGTNRSTYEEHHLGDFLTWKHPVSLGVPPT